MADLQHSRINTANALFKAKYRKYIDVAVSISLAVHLLAFAFIPKLDINPHETKIDELEVIDIPPEIEIPPPPKEIQRPKIPVETLDEEIEEEEEMQDTDLDINNLPDAPPPPPPSAGDWMNFDKLPKPKSTPFDPDRDYPTMARQAGIEGVVRLKVYIDERGNVVNVVILETVANGVFDSTAKEVVSRWKFEPAEQSGNPVKSMIVVPLRFSLSG